MGIVAGRVRYERYFGGGVIEGGWERGSCEGGCLNF